MSSQRSCHRGRVAWVGSSLSDPVMTWWMLLISYRSSRVRCLDFSEENIQHAIALLWRDLCWCDHDALWLPLGAPSRECYYFRCDRGASRRVSCLYLSAEKPNYPCYGMSHLVVGVERGLLTKRHACPQSTPPVVALFAVLADKTSLSLRGDLTTRTNKSTYQSDLCESEGCTNSNCCVAT